VVRPYLSETNQIQPLVLRPAAERLLRQALQRGEGATTGTIALDPSTNRGFLDAVGHALARRGTTPGRPSLLCPQDLRPHVRRLLERAVPHLGVLSFAEIPSSVTLTSSIPVEVTTHAA